MYSSFKEFSEIFDITLEPVRKRNKLYYVPDLLKPFVDLSHHRCVHAGMYLGEEKDAYTPSFSALSLIEKTPIRIEREGAWWFTNGKNVPAEYIIPPVTSNTPTVVVYEDMILGIGDIERGSVVPPRDVGLFLREGS